MNKIINSEILKWVKTAVADVAIKKTAFGRFKSPHGRGCEYFWFYPVFQSLGNLPYTRPAKIPNESNVPKSAGFELPSKVQDPILKIMEDLKPKRADIDPSKIG